MISRISFYLMLAAAVVGCAAPPTPVFKEGTQLVQAGDVEQGLARLEQAVRDNPDNTEYRSELYRQREIAIRDRLLLAEQAKFDGKLDVAEAAYRSVFRIEPNNLRAREGVAAVQTERRHREQIAAALKLTEQGDLSGAEELLAKVLVERPNHPEALRASRRLAETKVQALREAQPVLKPALSKTITLEFRDAPLASVFEMISRTSGINFVFDRDVRADIKVNIFVRNTTIEDVIKLLMITNQLERKVLNENSVLIYPNIPAKARDYQELMVRTFYLGNADAKQTLTMLKTVAKTKDAYIDEKLNLIIIRDTPEAVRLAEKLILTQDLAEPEVTLELEVLEVARSRLDNLGISYPESVSIGVLQPDGTGLVQGAVALDSDLVATVLNPAVVINLKRTDGNTRVLANPRIRVKNREKAKVHVGEKVPVVTTTSTANVGVSSSVSYLDTGLKLDVEPSVHLEDEVEIKVGLEVSNILETVNISGTLAYRLGTRNTATTLRLRDGETQILAGLISDEDRRSTAKVPLLAELPVLGALFRNNNDTRNKTEIVLLITPRVVRNIVRPEAVDAQFSSGTDAAPGVPALRLKPTAPGSLSMSSGKGGAAVAGATSAAPLPELAQPTAPAPSEPVAVTMSGPASVRVGEEFSINLTVAPSAAAQGQLQLIFDPQSFELTGASVETAATDPGRVSVRLNQPGSGVSADLRFRVIARTPRRTPVAVQGLSLAGASGEDVPITLPGPLLLNITQ